MRTEGIFGVNHINCFNGKFVMTNLPLKSSRSLFWAGFSFDYAHSSLVMYRHPLSCFCVDFHPFLKCDDYIIGFP